MYFARPMWVDDGLYPAPEDHTNHEASTQGQEHECTGITEPCEMDGCAGMETKGSQCGNYCHLIMRINYTQCCT